MKQPHWSPADLDRQAFVVKQSAVRADADRQRFRVARERWVSQLRRVLGGPLGPSACFVAGVALGGRNSVPDDPGSRPSGQRWPSVAAGVFKALVLRALMPAAPTTPEGGPSRIEISPSRLGDG